MSFLYLKKNGLSFGHDINGQCRCVEFVSLGVIIMKDFELGLKMKPRDLAQEGCLIRTGHLPKINVCVVKAWFDLQVF